MSVATQELASKLKDLLEQYKQVEELLESDPKNRELLDARSELRELIALTEELHKESIEGETTNFQGSVSSSSNNNNNNFSSNLNKINENFETQTAHNSNENTHNSLSYPVGTQCQAIWSGDGLWYDAVIDAITPEGTYAVTFIGYGNKENVSEERMRPKNPPPNQSKKRKVEEDDGMLTIPKHLQILPTDNEEERARKKRKIKTIKSKNRMKKMEKHRDQKMKTWKDFNNKKSRKVGFLTGIRKESIFKSPDSVTGKVGVTGSGASLTPNPEDARVHVSKKTKKKITLLPSNNK